MGQINHVRANKYLKETRGSSLEMEVINIQQKCNIINTVKG